jgi:hypothetical protein
MRRAAIFCAVACCLSAAHAAPHAPPGKSSEPTSLSIKTANDLADACTLTPNSKASFARLTFCTGFAQGVLQTNGQNPNGTKVCMPDPSPKRSETMKEFANWVRADMTRRVELASAAFIRFMAGRFPCK